MEYLLIGIIIVLGVLLLLKKKKTPDEEKLPYQYKKRTYFFTKNELNFYRELAKETASLNLVLFSKVRLADIIEPREKGSTWQSQFNRIRSKHVDFVLCDLPSIKPVLVIELDDSSHDRTDRQERDSKAVLSHNLLRERKPRLMAGAFSVFERRKADAAYRL
ncbi:DUF2726 domain-containing protein [Clostridium sp. MSTE9]|uniref:DUF2726 domain-containing protein n=1 Tax=Clostridium sp. (strain MSTE9) TaxID=1105031 RepID=UPI000684A334|nr:DUF2726 domain-containing protein [Clostridium sp. MSTE9]